MKLSDWFFDRYAVQSWIDFFRKKYVPVHKHSIWYYTGGFCLFLFMVQVVTGILLLLYYRPTAEAAFESVQFIMTKVRFGWLIRSIHSWSANLLIGALFIHMFAKFFLKSYRKPRELTWVSGMLLFLIFLGFGFSGYLLPWNELAYTATKVGTEMTNLVPFVGKYLLVFLRGGEQVSGATLTRFFGFHVAVLPIIVTVILAFHLLVIQIQGMSVPIKLEEHKSKLKQLPFFPDFMLHDMLGWLVAFGVLAALAALFPWELGTKADPFIPTPIGIHPEWYFVFTYQTLKLVPSRIFFIEGEVLVVFGLAVGIIFWLLVPFLDRKSNQGIPAKFFTIVGIIIVIYIIVTTIMGYVIPA
ncbi:MAG: cytochrome bc complex cytochrome b subunit [Calditrichaeota bacterium]|nr:cytochrome bc complex cytochrome b subunit [Calditrichota bacterium]